MKTRAPWLCVQTSVWVLASVFCVTSLTGCGATGNFTQGLGPDTAVQGLGGVVHGGPNPVIGASVTLYATTTVASPSSSNNYGYGQAGTVLGTATTDSNGAFSFTGDASKCTSGQQAYIVAAGGKTGANSANSAALLMAALGPCSGISDSTQVIIDEPTTIAAAYALSGFMTVSGTTVNISAPANNNGIAGSSGAAGACTTSGGVTTGCVAAGLAHAFLNAANLVNSTTGAANSTVPNNSAGFVPQLLINTLANSVEACINSAGAGSTACTTLMTDTTPTELTSPTAPTSTLQALLDLARYPSPATGSTCTPTVCTPSSPSTATTSLFDVANSNSYYQPALTAAPFDFTIAIWYATPTVPYSALPSGIATDIDDNVYVNYWADNEPVSSSQSAVISFTSNGTEVWSTAFVNNGDCNTYSTGYVLRCGVATDTLGNVWVADAGGLHQLSTAGVLGSTYAPDAGNTLEDLTVDLGNNVWTAAYNNASGNSALEELLEGTNTYADVDVGGAVESDTELKDPVFDSAGNLWCASDNAAGSDSPGVLLMISSNNSLTSPSFSYTSSQNPFPIIRAAGSEMNSPMMDSSGNMWVGSSNELNEVLSSGTETGGAKNYSRTFTTTYGRASGTGIWESGGEVYSAMDGDNKIAVEANTNAGGEIGGYLSMYYPNAPSDGNGGAGEGGADVYLNPCGPTSLIGGETFCASQLNGQSNVVWAPRETVIDASGAIWATIFFQGNVIQVLGPGAPNWPQASYIPKAMQTNTSRRPY